METGQRAARRIEVSNHYDKVPFVGTNCQNGEHAACPWWTSIAGQSKCKCECHRRKTGVAGR